MKSEKASLSREGDRALGFPEVSLPSFGGSRRAVEGVHKKLNKKRGKPSENAEQPSFLIQIVKYYWHIRLIFIPTSSDSISLLLGGGGTALP